VCLGKSHSQAKIRNVLSLFNHAVSFLSVIMHNSYINSAITVHKEFIHLLYISVYDLVEHLVLQIEI
jgi:hypothetical protein